MNFLAPALSLLALSLAAGQTGPTATPTPITTESLLGEMTDRAAVALFPAPAYTCKQFSSYDRASTSKADTATWFANADQGHYLRTETNDGRTEYVMADMQGPGAIVRIWTPDPKGTLRVYLDGGSTPAIALPMQDLLEGKSAIAGARIEEPIAGMRARGWNLYLPIPYAKSCKVTGDAKPFYYHVNYRTYAAGTAVTTFDPASLPKIADVLALTRDALKGKTDRPALPGDPSELAPGAEQTLNFSAAGSGGQAIDALSVFVHGANVEQALRSTVIIATFDGEQTVWCPVSDFFGSGVGVNPHSDRYRTVTPEGVMISRFVMPFRKEASITFKNLGEAPVQLGTAASTTPMRWTDRTMHFAATWRAEYPIHAKGGVGTMDWNYVEVHGKGVYVGDNLAVMNPVPEWWGEGDEKIYVDGETFPSHFGTGTEDYYGYGWCTPVVFSMPFNGQPRVDGRGKNNWGHTTNTRVRALDAIPFTSALNFDIEVWHWVKADIAFAATTYYYALPGATTNRIPDEAAAKATIPQAPPLPPPFTIKNAIECEALQVASKSPGITTEPQDMTHFGKDLWSSESQLLAKGKAVGDYVELRIPAPAGKHTVTLYATKSWDYAAVKFSVNGITIASPSDLYSGQQGKVVPSGPIPLGVAESQNGFITLRAEITGKNAASHAPGTYFGLDAVVLAAP